MTPMKGVSLLDEKTPTTDENILRGLERLTYPKWATIKLDGIRAERLKVNEKPTLLSYKLKPIPSDNIREASLVLPSGSDMELYNPIFNFQQIQSRVMSKEHPEAVLIQFHLLDIIDRTKVYEERISTIQQWVLGNPNPRVKFQHPVICPDAATLFEYFLLSENTEQEGICFRSPNSPYKFGRGTLDQEYLIKLCRWLRCEVTIIGFEEQMENGNAEQRTASGYMDRSHSISNKFGKNTLGKFVVKDKDGRIYRVGTGVGLTDKLRKHIWDNQRLFINKIITVKYKPHGEKDLPRSPIFVGFREKGY